MCVCVCIDLFQAATMSRGNKRLTVKPDNKFECTRCFKFGSNNHHKFEAHKRSCVSKPAAPVM